jgi:hypothetical protein
MLWVAVPVLLTNTEIAVLCERGESEQKAEERGEGGEVREGDVYREQTCCEVLRVCCASVARAGGGRSFV